LTKRAFYSPTIRKALEDQFHIAHPGQTPKGVILHIETRWNSFTDSLERGIELRPLLDAVCVAAQFNVPNRPRLDRLKLTTAEWEHIEALLPLLKVRHIQIIQIM